MDMVITAVVSALLGSGGMLGVCMHFFKIWIEKKLAEAENQAKQHRQDQQDRFVVEDEYKHAIGRFVFWTEFGVKKLETDLSKTYWNGEFQNACEAVREAESKKKELDRRQLASVNEE